MRQLTRAAATTDILTDGRLVLGLGAGHAETEFRQAGLAYPPAGRRVDRLEATLAAVRRLLAGGTVDDQALGLQGAAVGFRSQQQHVPLLVGGDGDRVLRLAGAQAEVAGLVGFTAGSGQVGPRLTHWTWTGLADRIAHVRDAARSAGRSEAPEIDLLVQRVIVTDDRATAPRIWPRRRGPPWTTTSAAPSC